MYDQGSDQHAGVSMVKLRHSIERMLDSTVSTNKPSIDGLELALMVNAARLAVYADVDS
jgi:hypothetical protein